MRLLRIVTGLSMLLALPVAAEEIVYFNNGQSLPVRSTELIDGMVHVDLGDNAFLAFPESSIDRIEVAGKDVAIKPSYGSASNRRVPTPEGSYPSQNFPRPQDRKFVEMDNTYASPVETDERTGLAGYRPMAHSPGRNKRQMFVHGNVRVLGNHPTKKGGGETYTGTTQLGSHHVIGGITPRRNPNAYNPNTPEPVSIELNPGGAAARPADQGAPAQKRSDNN
jgi:hypothetical protein